VITANVIFSRNTIIGGFGYAIDLVPTYMHTASYYDQHSHHTIIILGIESLIRT
jgi:hypothetical protein